MIKYLIDQWEENKNKLEEYFKTTKQEDYSSYKQILIKLFEICLPKADEYSVFDLSKMTVINDGDYQGTEIFIIPRETYQPSIEDYVVTHNSYGSCSGCDTLQSISQYEDGLPDKEQINGYMTIALHLVQRLKYISQED